MLFRDIVTASLQAIRANAMRSMLTMLGIIIGVAALITMVSLGTGAQRSVQSRIEALGPDLLTIFPGQSFRGGVASETRVSITVDDALALARDARYLKAVVPELSRHPSREWQQEHQRRVVGTTPNHVA